MTTCVSLSPQALDFLQCATWQVRSHLIASIKDKAQHVDQQMVVISYTCDGCWPWIERAMKSYIYRPGIRVLFHVVKHDQHIHIDRIAWRDCDPYGDETNS